MIDFPIFSDGQSNCLGYGSGGPWSSGINTRVKFWNNDNIIPTDGTDFLTPVFGSAPFPDGPYNNMVAWFAHYLAEAHYADRIAVVMNGKGGASITEWVFSDAPYTPGPQLEKAIRIWQASGLYPAQVFHWMQSETDQIAGMSPDQYIRLFTYLRGILLYYGVIHRESLLIVTGIAEHDVASTAWNASTLVPLVAQQPNAVYVPTAGRAVDPLVQVHFTGEALAEIGFDMFGGFMLPK